MSIRVLDAMRGGWIRGVSEIDEKRGFFNVGVGFSLSGTILCYIQLFIV